MKVLVLTNQFPSNEYPYKGTFIQSQVKSLKKLGCSVIIIAPNYARDEKEEITDEGSIYRFKTFTKKVNDPLLRDIFKGVKGLISLLFFIISQIIKTIRKVKKEEIDIIHAHWILPSGFSALIASKITRKPLVITAHGSDLSFCGEKTLYRLFVCMVLRGADFFISISNELECYAKRICEKITKTKTIYIGIPSWQISEIVQQTFKQEMELKKTTKLIFAGSLYDIKGISYLLEAIKKLALKRHDFVLELIGSGHKIDEYKSYVEGNNISEFVHFLGFRSHKETLRKIYEANISIQSSITEGLSVFIQESLVMGNAIVATNVGGTSEIVKDGYNGFLVEPKNAQMLADKIDALLSSPQLIKEFGRKSREIAEEKLYQEKNMNAIITIYKQILKKTSDDNESSNNYS